MFNTDPYEEKMGLALVHFEDELKKVRTGRAHPDMLYGVVVEVYGQKMPLNQVANMTAPEPQLLQITPFDPSNVNSITQGIRDDQALGLTQVMMAESFAFQCRTHRRTPPPVGQTSWAKRLRKFASHFVTSAKTPSKTPSAKKMLKNCPKTMSSGSKKKSTN